MSNKKKNKKNKEKKEKTNEMRIKEAIEVKKKLESFGFPHDYQPILDFYQKLNEFVKNGDSLSDSISLVGYKRKLNFIFSKKINIPIQTTLLYDENI